MLVPQLHRTPVLQIRHRSPVLYTTPGYTTLPSPCVARRLILKYGVIHYIITPATGIEKGFSGTAIILSSGAGGAGQDIRQAPEN